MLVIFLRVFDALETEEDDAQQRGDAQAGPPRSARRELRAAITAQATRKLLVSSTAVLIVPITILVWRAASAKPSG